MEIARQKHMQLVMQDGKRSKTQESQNRPKKSHMAERRTPRAGAASRVPLSPTQRSVGREVLAGKGGPGWKGGPGSKGAGVLARRGVGVSACGVFRPVRGQEAWEYHEPGYPPPAGTPRTLPQKARRGI